MTITLDKSEYKKLQSISNELSAIKTYLNIIKNKKDGETIKNISSTLHLINKSIENIDSSIKMITI